MSWDRVNNLSVKSGEYRKCLHTIAQLTSKVNVSLMIWFWKVTVYNSVTKTGSKSCELAGIVTTFIFWISLERWVHNCAIKTSGIMGLASNRFSDLFLLCSFSLSELVGSTWWSCSSGEFLQHRHSGWSTDGTTILWVSYGRILHPCCGAQVMPIMYLDYCFGLHFILWRRSYVELTPISTE